MTYDVREGVSCPSSIIGATVAESPNLKWVVIRSDLLGGEEIVLVFRADDAREAERLEPGRVVYLLAEVQELFHCPRDTESVKKIHMIKKAFDGVIVPAHSRLGQRLRWEGLWE